MNDSIDDFREGAVWVIGAAVLICLCGWIFYCNASILDPRTEATRRATFEQSKAYRDGRSADVRRLEEEYMTAPEDKKKALRAFILLNYSNTDGLSQDTAAFVKSL